MEGIAGGQGDFTAWREKWLGNVTSHSYFKEIPLCSDLDLLVA